MSHTTRCPFYPQRPPTHSDDGYTTFHLPGPVFRNHADCVCPAQESQIRDLHYVESWKDMVCHHCGVDLAVQAQRECEEYDEWLMGGPWMYGSGRKSPWKFFCPHGGEHRDNLWEHEFGRPHRPEHPSENPDTSV
ncbi:hypothetical protein [Georgenia sp. H159]|uniref:hypothetical protein n=1 Tax=Georgenia sp. H159 TaxID=3076115 RepID=UPI002D780D28|nr:hypothetical protein [Georgenia sp. H159]